jgi:putative acetyltransferase
MLVRREVPGDVPAIRAVTARAFDPSPAESPLVDQLRADPGWIPALSLVATVDDAVVGHVACTRATLGRAPVLGLGPLSVDPPHQRRGVGSALVHTVLGAADALGEPLVVLLGDPRYYHRFGFVLADRLGIVAPVAEWAPHFQARRLSAWAPDLRGSFVYAEPFRRL